MVEYYFDLMSRESPNDIEELERRQKQMHDETLPLLADLKRVGFSNKDWQLGNSPDVRATQVLLRSLSEPFPEHVRSWAVRILGGSGDESLWGPLATHYRGSSDKGELRESLAASLAALATPAQVPEIIAFLKDRTLGSTRIFFLGSIARLRVPDRWTIIEDARNDPELRTQASHMLKQRDRHERQKEQAARRKTDVT